MSNLIPLDRISMLSLDLGPHLHTRIYTAVFILDRQILVEKKLHFTRIRSGILARNGNTN